MSLKRDLVRRQGYKSEEYSILTEDGYILGLHRLLVSRDNSTSTKQRPIAFMQHGLLSSSIDWVIADKTQSLGYLLVDQGYDVWLGNFRGNIYSKKHAWLPVTSSQFWNFSWDEMARYDLPAMINFVLSKTNSTSLNYIGYSMGTTTLFALSSLDPSYTKKRIKLAVLLAPVAAIPNMKTPLTHIFAPVLSHFQSNKFQKHAWTRFFSRVQSSWRSSIWTNSWLQTVSL